MPARCMICISPNRAILEEWYLSDRLNITDIFDKAKKELNEKGSIATFRRHFRLHVLKIIENRRRVDKLKQKKIEEEFRRDIKLAIMFRKHLQTIEDNIDHLKDNIENQGDRRLLLEFIKGGNDAIEKLLKFGEQLGYYQEDKYDIERKIMFCLKDLPVECIQKFKDNWDNYEE